jgi:Pyridine nucleotide-disulphide oxidoreductase
MLEYMIERVTSVENIFQHVKFSTEVKRVDYDKEREMFVVLTTDLITGAQTINEYDKCVWAGGVYSKPYYPHTIKDMLKEGGYSGKSMHSSEIVEFGSLLRGKKILLVGDNLSALDLALQAIKVEAEHVYITSGTQSGLSSRMESWPGNRAVSLPCLPTQVINNGSGLLCSPVYWNISIGEYKPYTESEDESVELADIAAVIFCTGYTTEMDYLAADLRMRCVKEDWSAPKGWRSQRNSLFRDVGDVLPSSELGSQYVCDNLYRHVLISNPNMMYIHPITEYYMPEIDAQAWALAAYVTGDTVLPTKEEMGLRNYLERLDELNIPSIRESMDNNYAQALLPLYYNPEHWLSREFEDAKYFEFFKENARHAMKLISRDQVAGGHGAEWGSYDMLSARGELIVDQFALEWADAWGDAEWRTFRDIDPTPFRSIYTGRKFALLKDHWMNLDDEGTPLPPRNWTLSGLATECIFQIP